MRPLPVCASVVDIRLTVPPAFRTRITHIDGIVAQLLRRIDAEAERRRLSAAPADRAA